jgi:hypothetical protein
MPLAETDRESDRHSRLAACNPLTKVAVGEKAGRAHQPSFDNLKT